MFASSLISTVVNLNRPGRYLHWSVFTVSEANLVLIVVMVVIFGAALLIPFPGHARRGSGTAHRASGRGQRAPRRSSTRRAHRG